MRIVDGRRARDDLGRAGVEEAQVEGEALNIVEAHLAVVLEDVVVGGAARALEAVLGDHVEVAQVLLALL